MRLFIILFLLLLSISVSAQEPIIGTVVDKDKIPIEFITVVTLAQDSTVINYTSTDVKGTFRLSSEGNPNTVKLSLIGFKDKLLPLTNFETTNLGQIVMEEAATSLDEVTITAEKPVIERKIDRLVVNVDKAIANTGGNALEILERSPGVNIDLNGGISLRGRPQVIVMINGKREQLSGQELTNYLRAIPENALEKIELIHQPSAAYDAEGSGGIINIVLKNSEIYGTNGSANVSVGRGIKNRSSAGINYNHTNEKFSLISNLNYSYNEYYVNLKTIRRYSDEMGDLDAILDNDAETTVPSKSVSGNIRLGFNISEKLVAGLNARGNRTADSQEGSGFSQIFDEDNNSTGGFTTESASDDITYSYNLGPYFSWQPNEKETWDFDGTIATYQRDADQTNTTDFFGIDTSVFQSDTLNGKIEGKLELLAARLDYKLQTENTGDFSAGMKVSNVTNGSNLFYTDLVDGEPVVNDFFTNDFIYEEFIQSGYVNWSKGWDKLSLQVGLRVENSDINGLQRITGEEFNQNYFQFFPSFFAQYKWKDFNSLGLSLGRRINRPNYNQLNPFKFFVDATTFRSGNPALIPELSWNIEANYGFKSLIDVSLSYSKTENNIIFVYRQDDDNRTTNVFPENIGKYNYLGMNVGSSFKPIKCWQSRINLELFYNEFLGIVNGLDLSQKAVAFRVSGNNTFTINKKLSSEISYSYQPTYEYGISKINPVWRIDLGMRQKVLKDRGSLRLAFTDIFWKNFPTGSTQFGNINETFESIRDTRVVTLSFQYNFGNNKIKETKKGTGAAEEELRRVG